MTKQKEENEEEEKYHLSKATQILFFAVVCASIIIKELMATAFLFCLLMTFTAFDVIQQQKRRDNQKC